jgi:hypothetical protein
VLSSCAAVRCIHGRASSLAASGLCWHQFARGDQRSIMNDTIEPPSIGE